MNSLQNKTELVAYVADLLTVFELSLPLTMTITPEASGGFSVRCVTEMLSDATEQDLAVLSFLPTQVNT